MKKITLFLFAAILLNTGISAQTNDYPFTVKVFGTGKRSIIFIPGFASSGDVWNATKAQYEKEFTCYTLTMAGFAGVPPQATPRFTSIEKAIGAYIQDKKIMQPIIIGHSMGGAWAMAVAADHPNMISKIIVVDALPCLPFMYDSTFKAEPGKKDFSAMTDRIKPLSEEQFYNMQKKSMAYLMADTAHLEEAVQWSVKSDRKTFGELYADFMNTDLREKIASVKCPALILLEPSFASVKQDVTRQYKNLKGAQLHYANKGLHFIMFDDTEWYNRELASFIK